MRYYRLEIINPKTGKPPVDSNGNTIGPFDTSRTPGCGLHVEFDVEVAGLDVVNSGTMLTIYGLPIDMLKQSVSLQGCLVRMKAGFVEGLPLANPQQQGEVIYGEIYLAYANWIGTNQTLNPVINPTVRKTDDGKPFSIEGEGLKGEKVSDVISRALQKAFPNKLIDCTVSDSLVLPEPWKGTYDNIGSLAMVVRSASIAMMRNERYSGVAISILSDRIRIYDNVSANWGEPKQFMPMNWSGSRHG